MMSIARKNPLMPPNRSQRISTDKEDWSWLDESIFQVKPSLVTSDTKPKQEKPRMQTTTESLPQTQDIQAQHPQSRRSRLVSFFDQPGGRAFALVLSSAMISVAIVIYAILMRPPRYLMHSQNNIIFDTRTGKWSQLSDAPRIFPSTK